MLFGRMRPLCPLMQPRPVAFVVKDQFASGWITSKSRNFFGRYSAFDTKKVDFHATTSQQNVSSVGRGNFWRENSNFFLISKLLFTMVIIRRENSNFFLMSKSPFITLIIRRENSSFFLMSKLPFITLVIWRQNSNFFLKSKTTFTTLVEHLLEFTLFLDDLCHRSNIFS